MSNNGMKCQMFVYVFFLAYFPEKDIRMGTRIRSFSLSSFGAWGGTIVFYHSIFCKHLHFSHTDILEIQHDHTSHTFIIAF